MKTQPLAMSSTFKNTSTSNAYSWTLVSGRFAPIKNLSSVLPSKKPNEFDKIKVDQYESR
jgi:hypothetical protein